MAVPQSKTDSQKEVSVLFVCLGNICRSPTAEGLFRHLAGQRGHGRRIAVDSAGMIAFHAGEAPDPRTQAAARARGVDLSSLRARQVTRKDFKRFDYILAMDDENLAQLIDLRPSHFEGHLSLFCDFNPNEAVRHVPDPYYGGPDGFASVFQIVEDASKGLLDAIERDRFA